jgi:hypothetical protein
MRRRLSGLWMATNRPREHRDFRASFFSFRVSHGGHGATEDSLAQIPKFGGIFEDEEDGEYEPLDCEIIGLPLSRSVLKIQIGISFQTAFVLAQETHSLIRFQAI